MEKSKSINTVEVLSSSRVESERELSTKGCCFLCLAVILNETNLVKTTTAKPCLVSINSLQRYFQSNKSREKEDFSVLPDEQVSSSSLLSSEPHIKVELCENCTKIISDFQDAFSSLEKAQMALKYCSGRVHHQISEGSKQPELVQNYSRRMKSDPETLSQLSFVDNLRIEIAENCATVRAGQSKSEPKREGSEEAAVKDEDYSSESQLGSEFEEEDSSLYSNSDSEDGELNDELTADNETLGNANIEVVTASVAPKPIPRSSSFPHKSKEAGSTTTKIKPFPKNSKTGSYDCPACNKQFTRQYSVKIHYESLHLKQRYSCDKCGGNSSTRSNLLKHKKICPKKSKSKFDDEDCFSEIKSELEEDNLQSENDSDEHELNDDPLASVASPPETLEDSENMVTMQTEIKTEAETPELTPARPTFLVPATATTSTKPKTFPKNDKTGNYDCPSCGNQFRTHYSLKLHYESIHLGKRYSCKKCREDFTFKTNLREHNKSCIHGKKSKYFQSISAKSVPSNPNIIVTVLKQEKTQMRESAVMSVPMPTSSSSTSPTKSVKRAPYSSFNGKYVRDRKTGAWHCSSCSKQFSSAGAAINHFKQIHLMDRYPCEKCGRDFTQKGYMIKHKMICDGTQKRISFAKGSNNNSKRYTFNPETGRYSCKECDKTYGSCSAANQHYTGIHLKRKYKYPKTIKCGICNMAAFHCMAFLKIHQKTCKATLEKRKSRILAMEKDPEKFNKNLPCPNPTCGKMFSKQFILNRHFKTVHMKESKKQRV